jgi:hypothetical protein
MRYCLLLAVLCCFWQGSLAALQEPAEHGNQNTRIPALAGPVSVTSDRDSKAPKQSLSTSFQWENGSSFARSFRYLKIRMFGATKMRSDESDSVNDQHQTLSSRTRFSSLRRTRQGNVAPSPMISARSLASEPMPVELNQPTNFQPTVPIVPAPIPATRAEPTDPPAPVPENCLKKPVQLSCPASSACPGKNAMKKEVGATCENACVPAEKCAVAIKKKQGFVCGWCSS